MDIGSIILGAVGGAAISAGGNLLKFWRSGAVTEANLTRISEIQATSLKAFSDRSDLRFSEIERQFEAIERHRAETSASQREATVEMRTAAIQIARLSESQSIINAMTAKMLETLTVKTEANSSKIDNCAQVIEFVRANCKNCGD